MKIKDIMCEQTIKLTDLYDDNELNDETEIMYNFIDVDDSNRNFKVHTMTPQQAKNIKTASKDTTVYQSYKDFATKEAKLLVNEKIKYWDRDRIILLINDVLLDGNHHFIAGIKTNKPIKYINLAEYSD